jgi:hypothetical protein
MEDDVHTFLDEFPFISGRFRAETKTDDQFPDNPDKSEKR